MIQISDNDGPRWARLKAILDKPAEEMNGFELWLARQAAGLSHEQAAELIGVGFLNVADWESEPLGSAPHLPWADKIDRAYKTKDQG